MRNSRAIALSDYRIRVDEQTEIRPFCLEDEEALFQCVVRNYTYLYHWMAWLSEDRPTRESTRDFLRFCEKAARDQTQYHGAIISRSQLVGSIGFPVLDWHNRLAQIGYWLDEDHTGRGIMTTAVRALSNYAFDALELNRIEIRCATTNRKSAAVAERLGFTREGTLRQSLLLHGSYMDDAIFGMLAADWQAPSR